MAEVKKTVLIEHRPEQIYQLVDRCEDYADFLPWCGGAEVIERTDTTTTATLHVAYHGIKTSFTTQNHKTFPSEMIITLQKGPFRHLEGSWHFKPLGELACKIEFELSYQFSNRFFEKMLGPVFNHIASTFVDAFVRRANQVYAKAL